MDLPLFRLDLKIGTYEIASEYPYRDFDILTTVDSINPSGDLSISGEIQNIGTETIQQIQVLVTVYNEAREVIDTKWTYIEKDMLIPSETGSFQMIIKHSNLLSSMEYYTLQIQGNIFSEAS